MQKNPSTAPPITIFQSSFHDPACGVTSVSRIPNTPRECGRRSWQSFPQKAPWAVTSPLRGLHSTARQKRGPRAEEQSLPWWKSNLPAHCSFARQKASWALDRRSMDAWFVTVGSDMRDTLRIVIKSLNFRAILYDMWAKNERHSGPSVSAQPAIGGSASPETPFLAWDRRLGSPAGGKSLTRAAQ